MIAALCRALLGLAWFAAIVVSLPADAQKRVAPLAVSAAPLACPTSPATAVGKDFSGQSLAFANFSRMDLTNANFKGATLQGVNFIGATLTGADFSGAKFIAGANASRPGDFTLAKLDSACFIGATFAAPTYFTHASLSCTDFSATDLSTGNAIFGDAPLRYVPPAGPTSCRTAFRQATMNCEFIDAWRDFDLTDARIGACLTQLTGRNFVKAAMAGVDFSGAVLDGSTFTQADLALAQFANASLQCTKTRCVDFASAKLQGANFTRANLTGANLAGAFLANNAAAGDPSPATMAYAHLKNVNLSYAQLTAVDFSNANFYGDQSANAAGGCAIGAGFTSGCASAQGATVVGTIFRGAYLYGVDFAGATISGADFSAAIAVGANFSGARLELDANGKTTSFRGAYLQGTNLDMAQTLQADLSQAFFDFNPDGNLIRVLLDGRLHNTFACANGACTPPTRTDVCVLVAYPATTVPAGNASITCPDGAAAAPSGCGAPGATNRRWASPWDIGAPPQQPPAWYRNAATYTPATPNADTCRGLTVVIRW